jgi:ABC-type uncharacterized transport system permease subunit
MNLILLKKKDLKTKVLFSLFIIAVFMVIYVGTLIYLTKAGHDLRLRDAASIESPEHK